MRAVGEGKLNKCVGVCESGFRFNRMGFYRIGCCRDFVLGVMYIGYTVFLLDIH